MSKISDRLKAVKETIASACAHANRHESEITLVVVTKTASLEQIREVIELGCTDLGENHVQHLRQIAMELDESLKQNTTKNTQDHNINWHMIGHLQRNKVKQVLKLVSLIHSVDTLRLAEEINTVSGKIGIMQEGLLQVNCSGEPQKHGAPMGAAVHLAEQIMTMPNVRLTGLMTLAPLTLNKDLVRACFAQAREIFEEIRRQSTPSQGFRHLSIGMSQDYEIAIEEGATLLRIGSAIFAG